MIARVSLSSGLPSTIVEGPAALDMSASYRTGRGWIAPRLGVNPTGAGRRRGHTHAGASGTGSARPRTDTRVVIRRAPLLQELHILAKVGSNPASSHHHRHDGRTRIAEREDSRLHMPTARPGVIDEEHVRVRREAGLGSEVRCIHRAWVRWGLASPQGHFQTRGDSGDDAAERVLAARRRQGGHRTPMSHGRTGKLAHARHVIGQRDKEEHGNDAVMLRHGRPRLVAPHDVSGLLGGDRVGKGRNEVRHATR